MQVRSTGSLEKHGMGTMPRVPPSSLTAHQPGQVGLWNTMQEHKGEYPDPRQFNRQISPPAENIADLPL